MGNKTSFISQRTRRGFIEVMPEEREINGWVKQSGYDFAEKDVSREGEWSHPLWFCWAVPLVYMYEDYRKWKLPRPGNPLDRDSPLLLTRRQFGVALRTLFPDLDGENEGGMKRRVQLKRRCFRTGIVKTMLMYRGICHPEAFYISAFPGRPAHDAITPSCQTPAAAPEWERSVATRREDD